MNRRFSAFALVLATSVGAQPITLTDGGFSNWSSTPVVQPGSSASFAVNASGGVGGGPFLAVTTNSGLYAGLAMWSPGFTYDTAVGGPLQSLSFAFDTRANTGFGQGQGVHPLVRQNGRIFVHPEFEITGIPMGWVSRPTPGTLLGFDRWDRLGAGEFRELLPFATATQRSFSMGCAQPDFQSGVLEFGFMAANSISGTYTHDYDNVTFTLHRAPVPGWTRLGGHSCAPGVPPIGLSFGGSVNPGATATLNFNAANGVLIFGFAPLNAPFFAGSLVPNPAFAISSTAATFTWPPVVPTTFVQGATVDPNLGLLLSDALVAR